MQENQPLPDLFNYSPILYASGWVRTGVPGHFQKPVEIVLPRHKSGCCRGGQGKQRQMPLKMEGGFALRTVVRIDG